MDALADGLEDLDVDGGCAAVVAVVVGVGVRRGVDGAGAFGGGEGAGGGAGDARDDVAGVEGEDGGVRVDGVWVEDGGVFERGEDGGGEVGGEGVFVGAAEDTVRTRRREGARGEWFTRCICVPWLGGQGERVREEERRGGPWKHSVSWRNQRSQLCVPSWGTWLKAPGWYILGLCANCARSMREKMMVSSRRVRMERMRSRESGSSASM